MDFAPTFEPDLLAIHWSRVPCGLSAHEDERGVIIKFDGFLAVMYCSPGKAERAGYYEARRALLA